MTFTLSASIISRKRQLCFAVKIALRFRWGLFFLPRKPLVLLGLQHFKNKYKPETRPMSQREITSWQSPGRLQRAGEASFGKGCRSASCCDSCLQPSRWNPVCFMACTGVMGWHRGHPWALKAHECPQTVCDCRISPCPEEGEGLLAQCSPAIRHNIIPAETLKFTVWHFKTFFFFNYYYFFSRHQHYFFFFFF